MGKAYDLQDEGWKMIKYFNKVNGMIYWVEDNIVMCDERDRPDAIPSCFTVEEFRESVSSGFIEELK